MLSPSLLDSSERRTHTQSSLQKEKEEIDDITLELELADEDDVVP